MPKLQLKHTLQLFLVWKYGSLPLLLQLYAAESSGSIVEGNTFDLHCVEEVRRVVQQPAKRGQYTKFTSAQRAVRAAEHSVAATVCYYEKRCPNCARANLGVWLTMHRHG